MKIINFQKTLFYLASLNGNRIPKRSILEFQIILSNNNNILMNKTFNRENIKIKEIIGDKAFLMITKINLKIVKGLIKIGIQGDFN